MIISAYAGKAPEPLGGVEEPRCIITGGSELKRIGENGLSSDWAMYTNIQTKWLLGSAVILTNNGRLIVQPLFFRNQLYKSCGVRL